MKRRMGGLLLLSILLLAMAPAALAAGEALDLVSDTAYLLSDDEYWALNERALALSQQYPCEVLVITVESIGSDDPYDFAKYIHEGYDIGHGPQRSCLIFLLSMEHRDYALVAYGYGNTAFTDYGKDVLLDAHVLPILADDRYYEAFSAYYEVAESYLQMAEAGAPFDTDTDPDYGRLSLPVKLGITFGLPLIVAAILCGIWKAQMRSAVPARDARNYIPQDGFVLTAQQDLFLFRTETRRRIEKSSSGGTTTDRSGASGRKGTF